jgi:hypothetical protein
MRVWQHAVRCPCLQGCAKARWASRTRCLAIMQGEHICQPSEADLGTREPVTLAGWTVEGVSVAGQETCILLPALKLAFDIGRCPNRSIGSQHVFITHAHMDILAAFPFTQVPGAQRGRCHERMTCCAWQHHQRIERHCEKVANFVMIVQGTDGSTAHKTVQRASSLHHRTKAH